MRSVEQKWREFWADKTLPLHTRDTEDFYELNAKELGVLLPTNCGTVLEIGCGSGALYPYLEGRFEEYTGVDYSESMLGTFRERFPAVRLICEDGSSYLDQNHYDLIICSGVVQYFDHEMLLRFLANVAAMLRDDGMCLLGMVPDKRLRMGVVSGYLRRDVPVSGAFKTLLRYLRQMVMRREGIGSWFDVQDFMKDADSSGLTCEVFGSMLYRYRFHAVMRKRK